MYIYSCVSHQNMCKSCTRRCKTIPKLGMPKASEWRVSQASKHGKLHRLIFGLVLAAFVTWVILSISTVADIEYRGSRRMGNEAFKITGVDMMDDAVRLKHQTLVTEMRYACGRGSDDVVFAFQFDAQDSMIEDHLFYLCDKDIAFGNAMVMRGQGQIQCTEEFNGELRQVVRQKRVTIKYVNIDDWKQAEYTTTSPKDACILQHAIDVLENKW